MIKLIIWRLLLDFPLFQDFGIIISVPLKQIFIIYLLTELFYRTKRTNSLQICPSVTVLKHDKANNLGGFRLFSPLLQDFWIIISVPLGQIFIIHLLTELFYRTKRINSWQICPAVAILKLDKANYLAAFTWFSLISGFWNNYFCTSKADIYNLFTDRIVL